VKKVHIAFDVDGTLIRNDGPGDMDGGVPVANERIRSLLVTLASFKNTRITVWSGGGELYARQVVNSLGLSKYVDDYAGKNLVGKDAEGNYVFEPGFKPDIAIDDIQHCDLGNLNLIVREK
jgi:hydroxymethylpyrimidine pyrophosphatase-like HAD family hydrolase